ncbi:hypothetical protein J437_LFUL017613 [Ladona fulva]|uniref:Endonuclease/exonuclease/phosphatase domain-containing protein n=1 Tax=Ladona fulva TaxID=123851 RepID=A0A8K0PC23_LADFU|nr:hypothetical protein J437_LFUL017613 [Ladona fulva]
MGICAIQETHLTITQKIHTPNFQLICKDRLQRGGGVAFLVNNNIGIKILPRIKFNVVEYIGITVLHNNEPLNLFSIYIPPRGKYTQNELDTELRTLLTFNGKNVYMGDWNCKHIAWGSRTFNPNGNLLFKIINDLNTESQNINIHSPYQPTHFHQNKSTDLLDFIITNNHSHSINKSVLFEFQSDHLPLLIDIQITQHLNITQTITITNWEKYYEYIQNHIYNIHTLQEYTPKHIDTQTKLITDLFYLAKTYSSKTTPKLTKQQLKLPQHIHKLISLCNKHRRLFLKYKNPADQLLHQSYKKEIRKEIQNIKNQEWTEKIESLKFEDNSIWRITKALTKTVQPPTPLVHNNTYYSDPQNKANIFANYLGEIMVSPKINYKTDNNVITHYNSIEFTPNSEPNLITPNEIKLNIKNLKTKKAPGSDDKTNQMLKIASNIPHFLTLLSDIFNACLTTSHFPTKWKLGIWCVKWKIKVNAAKS